MALPCLLLDCQNGGQAKSILIKMVLQKSPQKWYPPNDGAAESKGDILFGAMG